MNNCKVCDIEVTWPGELCKVHFGLKPITCPTCGASLIGSKFKHPTLLAWSNFPTDDSWVECSDRWHLPKYEKPVLVTFNALP